VPEVSPHCIFNVNVEVLLYPPDAVIVMVELPTFAVLPRVKFKVTVPPPGAFSLFAIQAPVIPAGKAELENVIEELNPPTAVIVTVKLLLAPGANVSEDGLTVTVNPETFTTTLAVRETPPPLAVMVSV